MQLEDTLDTLLSLGEDNERPSPAQMSANSVLAEGEFHELQPLLDAADRLAELGNAQPSPNFAGRLETHYFVWAAQAEAEAEAEADAQMQNGVESSRAQYSRTPFPGPVGASLLPAERDMPVDMPPLLGNDAPTLPSLLWSGDADDATEADAAPSRHAGSGRQHQQARRARWSRLVGPAVAAALLLVIGGSTLTAAAAAPGTPLYGLRRWEQKVQVSMAGSAGDRTKLHLAYAQDALAALNAAAARHQAGAPYDDALATFRDEMSAASATLEGVPAGGEHDALAAQVDQIRAQGRVDLRTALIVLPWSARVATTAALAAIGDSVLQVAQASVERLEGGQHLWEITVTGAGFQQGAVLLIDGQSAGTVISVSATTLEAHLSRNDFAPLPSSIGVANPDSTAAVTSTISGHDQDDTSSPTPQQTPGGDDHGGGHDGGGGGSDGGGHSGSGSGSGSGSSTPGGSGSSG